MNKKLIIGALAVVLVAALAVGYLSNRNSDSEHFATRLDEVTGKNIYTNLDYGFSIPYASSSWEGPAETMDTEAETDYSRINAVFRNASTSEALLIVAEPGDTKSLNDTVTGLDLPYTVVTVGGLPALRYEYVTPLNEEGTLYGKIVMLTFKGLSKGSITMAYQQLFPTEAEAKKASLSRLNELLTHMSFDSATAQ